MWIVAVAAVLNAFVPSFYVVRIAETIRKSIHRAIAEQAVEIF